MCFANICCYLQIICEPSDPPSPECELESHADGHFTAFCVSLSVCVLFRCRLSCTEALAHPWMVSFTPLTRRPTKSLNKGKMKHFLAKHKWKVGQLRHELRILSRH